MNEEMESILEEISLDVEDLKKNPNPLEISAYSMDSYMDFILEFSMEVNKDLSISFREKCGSNTLNSYFESVEFSLKIHLQESLRTITNRILTKRQRDGKEFLSPANSARLPEQVKEISIKIINNARIQLNSPQFHKLVISELSIIAKSEAQKKLEEIKRDFNLRPSDMYDLVDLISIKEVMES